MTLFESNPADPSDLAEASRLAKTGAAIWFGGWVVPMVLVAVTSGRGEMALLGALAGFLFIIAVGAVSTIFSFRFAWRALGLDPGSLLAKITIGLNGVSTVYVLIVGGFLLTELIGW